MQFVFTFEGMTALATLVFLEIILGIDNVIFISIVANKLPEHQRSKAWRFGLILALVIRLIMLLTISFMMKFHTPLFSVYDVGFSIRDIILLLGGMFLIYKSTKEIGTQTMPERKPVSKDTTSTLSGVVLQIVLIDFIFSFDSILTAVGLSDVVLIMVLAVLISIAIMMLFLGAIGDFIKRNHTMEILALAFLILIGFILVLESFHYVIPKGYIYFAVAFSFVIELLNMRSAKARRAEAERADRSATNAV